MRGHAFDVVSDLRLVIYCKTLIYICFNHFLMFRLVCATIGPFDVVSIGQALFISISFVYLGFPFFVIAPYSWLFHIRALFLCLHLQSDAIL